MYELTIMITKEHIANGRRLSLFNCLIALAVNAYFDRESFSRVWGTVWVPLGGELTRFLGMHMDRAASRFISQFDHEKKVSPRSIVLTFSPE